MPSELVPVILVFGVSVDLALIARTLFKVPQLCSPNRVKTQCLTLHSRPTNTQKKFVFGVFLKNTRIERLALS